MRTHRQTDRCTTFSNVQVPPVLPPVRPTVAGADDGGKLRSRLHGGRFIFYFVCFRAKESYELIVKKSPTVALRTTLALIVYFCMNKPSAHAAGLEKQKREVLNDE